jgi:hypothetical protein
MRRSSDLAHAKLDLIDDAVIVRFFAEDHQGRGFLPVTKVGYLLSRDTRAAEFIQNRLAIQAEDNFTAKKLLSI